MTSETIRIGISSCLLGHKVRFDGNHKQDGYIVGTLGRYFEFVPICPEVAIGLGVPRPPIRLVGDDPEQARAVGVRDPSMDVTERLAEYGRSTAAALADISGYILKSKSPSCGMARVPVYQAGAAPRRGRGVFARELLAALPLLPVEEEGRLNDPALRENFLERVFAYRRWQALVAAGLTPAKLVEFHTRHKLSLMAHGIEGYRALGRLVARTGSGPIGPIGNEYATIFMATLTRQATRKRHTNVLMHMMGYLKRHLERDDKAELLDLVDRYRLGELPLVVPLTLLQHHLRRHPTPYLERQVYLHPHPRELMLRNCL